MKRALIVTDSFIWEMELMGNVAHDIVERCGWEPLRLEWNHRHYVPSSPAVTRTGRHLALFGDASVYSAPRLSHREYVELCGDDIDFAKITMKDDWIDGWAADETHLSPESPALQRLRGAAWQFDNFLAAVRPDAVIIRQGCDPFSLVNMAKALKAGIPAFFLESGFFPGSAYFELQGMHFYPGLRRLDALYEQGAGTLPPAEGRQAAELLQRLRQGLLAGGVSKYSQAADAAETAALEGFAKKFSGRLAFFPEQMPLDSNVFAALRHIGADSLGEIYGRVLEALPGDVGLVFKRHPKMEGQGPLADLPPQENVLFLERLSIIEIFKRVAAVITLTSNVGLEAAIGGLPVLSLGAAVYAGKGFTLDWDGQADLGACLREIFQFRPDEAAMAAFVHLLKKEVLFSPEEPPADFDRLCLGDEYTPRLAPRAPCWQEGRGRFAEYYRLKEDYARLYRENYSHPEIMARLGRPVQEASGSPGPQLFSAAPPAAPGVTDRVQAARYALAAKVLPPAGRILEAGCGLGCGAHYLARRTGGEVLAFDHRPEAAGWAREAYCAPNLTYRAWSAGSFIDEDASSQEPFALALAFDFLERLPAPEIFVAHLKKRLAPGGVFIGGVPHSEVAPLAGHPLHVRHYDLPALKNMLALQPGEEAVFFYQTEAEIGLNRAAGRFIIFALSRDASKLERLTAAMPFKPGPLGEPDETPPCPAADLSPGGFVPLAAFKRGLKARLKPPLRALIGAARRNAWAARPAARILGLAPRLKERLRNLAPPEPPGWPKASGAEAQTAPVLTRTAIFRRRELKILVIKLDHMGDLLLARPAVAKLKARYPYARLDAVVGGWNAEVAASLGVFTKIFTYDFFKPVSSRPPERDETALARVLAALDDYDLAIDLRRVGDTRRFLAQVKARLKAGYETFDPRLDAGLDVKLPAAPDIPFQATELNKISIARQMTALVDALPEDPNDYIALPELQLPRQPSRAGHLAVFPLAGNPVRDWGRENYVRLIEELAGLEAVRRLTVYFRNAAEAAAFQAPEGEKIEIQAGLSWPDLVFSLSGCALSLSNNSLGGHLAGCLGLKNIAIYGGQETVEEWGPPFGQTLAVSRPVDCSPCHLARIEDCRRDLMCLKGISVEYVRDLVLAKLSPDGL